MTVALILAASRASPASTPHLTRIPDPVLHPHFADASRFATRWPIKHVVFIVKENRSFDNLFGRFPGADGVTVGSDYGTPRPLTRAPDRTATDFPHDYRAALTAIDSGSMDGFNQGPASNAYAYTQFWRDQIPSY